MPHLAAELAREAVDLTPADLALADPASLDAPVGRFAPAGARP